MHLRLAAAATALLALSCSSTIPPDVEAAIMADIPQVDSIVTDAGRDELDAIALCNAMLDEITESGLIRIGNGAVPCRGGGIISAGGVALMAHPGSGLKSVTPTPITAMPLIDSREGGRAINVTLVLKELTPELKARVLEHGTAVGRELFARARARAASQPLPEPGPALREAKVHAAQAQSVIESQDPKHASMVLRVVAVPAAQGATLTEICRSLQGELVEAGFSILADGCELESMITTSVSLDVQAGLSTQISVYFSGVTTVAGKTTVSLVVKDASLPREVETRLLDALEDAFTMAWKNAKQERAMMPVATRLSAATAAALGRNGPVVASQAAAPVDAGPAPAASAASVTVSASIPEPELRKLAFKSLAVPRASGAGVDKDVLTILTDASADAASQVGGLSVTGASDIDSMLGFQQQKDLLGCSDVSCYAEIGGALGVDGLLAVKVGKLGDTYRISASLIHLSSARAVARASVTTGDAPQELIAASERLAKDLIRFVIRR